jgi:hypothetical protein
MRNNAVCEADNIEMKCVILKNSARWKCALLSCMLYTGIGMFDLICYIHAQFGT